MVPERRKMTICCAFMPLWGRSFAAWIVVPPQGRRNSRSAALKGAHRLVGQLELVAATHEHAERTLALAVVGGCHADPAAEQRDGGRARLVEVLPAQRRLDLRRADARGLQAPG